ncbi:MAG TPA: hypothetical protein VHM70_31545 [Polyangiaceae bacterium]|jgi:hypothetical protein|nr:hypothetical protein [Polyangiaceae bacterium]
MSGEVLAKLQIEPDSDRGPDVSHRIRLARQWLNSGAQLDIALPRRVRCASCDGGGCDRCSRSGAFTLCGQDEPALHVAVNIPAMLHTPCVVRIPKSGAPGSAPNFTRGCLLLEVTEGATSSEVIAIAGSGAAPVPPTATLVRWLMVVFVLLLAAYWYARP